MNDFSLQGGYAKRILAGANIAELESSVEPHIRTVSVIEMIQVGQFDPEFVKWERCIASKFSFECGNFQGLRPAGNA